MKTITTKEFVAEWSKALRSGEFKQTHEDGLRHDGKYCCLGVACVVAERMGLRLPRGYVLDDHGLVPKCMLCLIQNDNPLLTLDDGTVRGAIGVNDDLRLTFPEIADCIDRTPWPDNKVEVPE